jgi:hypothetical protein
VVLNGKVPFVFRLQIERRLYFEEIESPISRSGQNIGADSYTIEAYRSLEDRRDCPIPERGSGRTVRLSPVEFFANQRAP